jgi:hypothetical protein
MLRGLIGEPRRISYPGVCKARPELVIGAVSGPEGLERITDS